MSELRHDGAAPTGTHPVPAGVGVAAHHHDEHQILYAGEGVISVSTDAGTWTTAAGAALWIPAGVTHENRAFGHARIHTVGLPQEIGPLRPPLRTPAVIAVDALLQQLIITYAAGPDDDTPQRRRLRDVLIDRLHTVDRSPLQLPRPSDPRLVELERLFRADPADRRTAPQLARRVGAGPRTLSRLCRAEMKMSFPQWRTRIRVHHALQLLAQDVPVTSVAERCGWATSSAFIEAFRTTVGHTPAAEQRAVRGPH